MYSYFQQLLTVKSSLAKSIAAQDAFTTSLMTLIEGDSVDDFKFSVVTSTGNEFNFDYSNSVLKVLDLSTNVTTEIQASDVDESSVINENWTLANIIESHINSRNTNAALEHLSSMYMSTENVSNSAIQSVLSEYEKTVSDGSIALLKQQLSTIPESKGSIGFLAYLREMYTSVKEGYTATQEDGVDRVELNVNFASIQSFVGLSIIDVLSTVIQIAAFAITKINAVLGILVSVIGSVLTTLFNTVIQDSFKINPSVINNYVDSPLLAFSFDSAGNTANKVFQQLAANDTYSEPNKLIRYKSLPYADFYSWMNSDNEFNLNGFIKPVVKPSAVQHFVPEYNAGYGGYYFNWDDFAKFKPSYVDEYLSNNNGYYTNEEVLALSDNDIINSMIAGLFLWIFSGVFTNSRYTDGDNNLAFIRPYYFSQAASDLSLEKILGALVSYDGDRHSHTQAQVDEYFKVQNYLATLATGSVSVTSELSNVYFEANGGYRWSFLPGQLITYASTWYMSIDDILFVPGTPSTFTFEVPDYTPTAIRNTLIAVGAITAAISAVAIIGKGAYRRWSNRAQYNGISNLQALKQQYDADPTTDNWDKYAWAVHKYNFKSKIFGWNSFDRYNGWVNNGSPDQTSFDASFIDDDGKVSLTRIVKLIKG